MLNLPMIADDRHGLSVERKSNAISAVAEIVAVIDCVAEAFDVLAGGNVSQNQLILFVSKIEFAIGRKLNEAKDRDRRDDLLRFQADCLDRDTGCIEEIFPLIDEATCPTKDFRTWGLQLDAV